MKTSPLLLIAVLALGISSLHAELPFADELLQRLGDSARAEAIDRLAESVSPEIRKALDLPDSAPRAVPVAPVAKVAIVRNTVYIREGAAAPRPVFTSAHHVRGATTNPDGSIIAVSTGTGSAGDSIFFLHRVHHANGVRYIREDLGHAVRLFIDDLYALDPELKRQPDRVFLTPVAVHRGVDFEFHVTGDNDITGRQFHLTITETGKPLLFNGGCDQ